MSKHPIDDLFASRLRDHSIKPERASWEELQRRIGAKEKRKTPFIGWYAAAASVGVVLLAAWWLWSNDKTGILGKQENPIAHHLSKKPGSVNAKTSEPKIDETVAPETAIAYEEKPGTASKTGINRQISTPVLNNSGSPQEIDQVEKSSPVPPVLADDIQKPQTLVADVLSKEPERTLVVQVVTPEIRIASSSLVSPPEVDEMKETDDEQPKKKRFRLGRVLRQFNKLKAGESVEWEEVGVQPGGLMARASEKVQEGKEKLTDSYENLRYNAFRKNSNNK